MGFASKVEIDGSTHSLASSLYGICTTSSGTPSKIVTCPDFDTLIPGTMIAVKFVYTNTAANPTMNVNGLGALPIYTDGTNAPGVTPQDSWAANSIVTFLYDGTAWRMADTAAFRSVLLDAIYPVGSIYMSANETNPSILFGGAWVQIKDKFLLSAGDSYPAGGEGGAETHKHTTQGHALTMAEMPSHNHNSRALSGSFSSRGYTTGSSNATQIVFTGTGIVSDSSLSTDMSVIDASGHSISGVRGTKITIDATHTHDTQGSNSAHSHGDTGETSNMPPYLAVYVWQRTA